MSDTDRAERAGRIRLRRACLWLLLAVTLDVVTLGSAVSLALRGPAWPVVLAAVVGLAAASLGLLLWCERRLSSVNRPSRWPTRMVAMMIPQSAALGIAGAGPLAELGLSFWQVVALLALSPLLQVALVVQASRSLRRPLTPELAETSIEIMVKLRTGRPAAPTWLSIDDVTLTDSKIVIILHPDPIRGVKYRVGIDLADVIAVDARAARQGDSPWIELPDGYDYHMSPGDVLEIRTLTGVLVLPIQQAVAFAELVRRRAKRAMPVGPRKTPTS